MGRVVKNHVKTLRKPQNRPAYVSEQQRLFIIYLVHHSLGQTAAARQAGYAQPASAAQTLMNNPKIKREIAKARAEYAEASKMTRKKVIDGVMEAIDMARIKAEPGIMLTGWRDVARMCGFNEPTKTKLEITGEAKLVIRQMENMSDAELLQLAQENPDILEGEYVEVEDETYDPPPEEGEQA